MVILLGDANKGTDSKLVRIIDIEGYHIGCANNTDKASGKVYVTLKSLFTKHKILFDYNSANYILYSNNRELKLCIVKDTSADNSNEDNVG